jgi:hypothetical protein
VTGFYHGKLTDDFKFVPPGSFIRSVFVQYDAKDEETRYTVNDLIDADMYFRLRSANPRPDRREGGSLFRQVDDLAHPRVRPPRLLFSPNFCPRHMPCDLFFYSRALSPLHITHSLVLLDCVPSTSAFQKPSEPIDCLSHMTDGHIPEAYSLYRPY